MEASPNRVVRPRRSCPRVLRASLPSSSAAAVIVVLALAACSPPPTPPAGFEPVTARFEADTEGWASAEGQAPTWQAPGYLSVADEGAGWQYAIAPAAFHGDWTGARAIRFRVLVDPGPIVYPLRVMVSSPEHTLYVTFALEALTPSEWVALSAPLTAGAWRHFDGEDTETGPVATPAELAATLADVVDLRFRLDLTDKFAGDEVNGLDDVVVE